MVYKGLANHVAPECSLRAHPGRTRARAEGKVLGRRPKMTAEQRKAIAGGYTNKQSVSALAKLHGVSRSTVLTIVKSG